jgi:hypothetical protein
MQSSWLVQIALCSKCTLPGDWRYCSWYVEQGEAAGRRTEWGPVCAYFFFLFPCLGLHVNPVYDTCYLDSSDSCHASQTGVMRFLKRIDKPLNLSSNRQLATGEVHSLLSFLRN